ncbi:MAG: hypothetical protein CMJ33_10610 [Phycisphaerae bacterium]|nr:hypothetical protein [Phycisphaerae bacterium]HAW95541.1 hypothetical protein [Phycisphaerales bacterium]
MNRSKLGGLVLLNIVLLGALALVSLSPNSAAVADGRSSTRGEYVAISGTIAGTKTPVIWVVNQASQELVAFQYEEQRNQLVGIGYRNLNDDARTIERSRQ